ncbi:hypothetical protein AB3G45_24375 [Shinella sp. S4-D37]|jgi:hypothetical protein|uniref:hypothetical protein n=1 Tax=Shinella sp. S4-D37 TaxID=3161999 RepID=UPI0034667E6C
MSKSVQSHPEFREAVKALIHEIDIPAHIERDIRHMVDPGLGRLLMEWWTAQDRADADFIRDPLDDGDDPAWYRTDGWPNMGGGEDAVLRRKWEQRARLWMRWHGDDVLHVVDWLIWSLRVGQGWLHDLNEADEPTVLAEAATLDDLVDLATEGLRHRPASESPDRQGAR